MMNKTSYEFNKQLELDVLINGLTKIDRAYVRQFDVQNLTDIIIPDGIKSIGYEAFKGYTNLTNILIPDTVTDIEAWAFAWCEGLTNITIPAGVTRIGNSAFRYCRSLMSASIGNGKTIVGDSIFNGCHRLTNITVNGKIIDEVNLRRIIQGDYIRKKLVDNFS